MGHNTRRSAWHHDVSAADWIASRLHPFAQDTGSIIPTGFDAYCRVFHPIGTDGRWADLAAANHRVAHAQMQLHAIATPFGTPPAFPGPSSTPTELDAVSWGSQPIAQRQALIDILTPHTTTPQHCWLAVWEGFGGLDDGGEAARVQLPNRSYLLASGPTEAVTDPLPTTIAFDWGQSPNLWWPDDRAWIVATEIDFAWTYVGGTSAAIDAVIADPRIEALPAQLTDLPFHDADTVDAALDRRAGDPTDRD